MNVYEVFEAAVRAACDAYQRGDLNAQEFVERIINARNALDLALISEQG